MVVPFETHRGTRHAGPDQDHQANRRPDQGRRRGHLLLGRRPPRLRAACPRFRAQVLRRPVPRRRTAAENDARPARGGGAGGRAAARHGAHRRSQGRRRSGRRPRRRPQGGDHEGARQAVSGRVCAGPLQAEHGLRVSALGGALHRTPDRLPQGGADTEERHRGAASRHALHALPGQSDPRGALQDVQSGGTLGLAVGRLEPLPATSSAFARTSASGS